MAAAEEVGASPSPPKLTKLAFRAPQQPYTIQDFSYGKLLGMGSYSKVVRAKKKDTGEEFALKIMDKKHIMRENKVAYVKMERLILDQLDHPGVVRLCFTFQDTYSLYMGLECCHGGELFDQIRRKGRLSLEEARFYAAEIVDVLEYIHGQGLIHRDLKVLVDADNGLNRNGQPENLLLTADGHMKLADFGSAKLTRPLLNGLSEIQPDDKSCTFVGTAEYVSPEVLNSQPVTIGADLWALGCIIYQMLEGRPPFKGGSEYLTFQKVLGKDISMPAHFSAEAKDLVNRLLDLEPDKRPGAGPSGYASLKDHPFFIGVDWSNVRQSPSPKLAPSASQAAGGDSEDSEDSDWELAQMGGKLSRLNVSDPSSPKSSNGVPEDATSPTAVVPAAAKMLEDANSEQWQKFLVEGEKLVATSLMRKYRKLSVKKRQLILTDRPRLVYVHPVKMVYKGDIPWSRDIYIRLENEYKFCICTPKRNYNLEDLKGQARLWKETIERLVQKTNTG